MSILNMRRRIMMAAVNNTITVNWNQLAPALNIENWEAQNSNYTSITFSNGEVTISVNTDTESRYQASLVTKSIINWNSSHKYYQSQELHSSSKKRYCLIFCTTAVNMDAINANTWSTMSSARYPSQTSDKLIYLGYPMENVSAGLTIKARNPVLIDLTQMFGAGNEPTAEEFETQCALNNIDLTSPLPYDSGISIRWKIY